MADDAAAHRVSGKMRRERDDDLRGDAGEANQE
jgi:hypothetical protein